MLISSESSSLLILGFLYCKALDTARVNTPMEAFHQLSRGCSDLPQSKARDSNLLGVEKTTQALSCYLARKMLNPLGATLNPTLKQRLL